MAQGRISSLDGLRGVSIAFVLVQHSVASTGSPLGKFTADFGRLGVWVFFVISGFVITHLLLREAELGPISLRRFYLRRALRLLPALLAFLIFLGVAEGLGADLGVGPIHYLSAALFLVPYVPWGAENHPWSTGHLWSLAVEEHFYLLWPPVLARLGVQRAKWLLVAFIAIVPGFRVLWYTLKLDPLANSLVGIGDLMAYGALAAIWHHREPERLATILRRHPARRRTLAALAVAAVLAMRTAEWLPEIMVPLGITAVGLAVAYLLLSVCFGPPGIGVAALNLPVIASVGGLSYSLYLWQQPFLHKPTGAADWWQQFPTNLGLAVLAAVGSFALVERPLSKLKGRLRISQRG